MNQDKLTMAFSTLFNLIGIRFNLESITPISETKLMPAGIAAAFSVGNERAILLNAFDIDIEVICSIKIVNTKTSRSFNLLNYLKCRNCEFLYDDFRLRASDKSPTGDLDISRLVQYLGLASLRPILDGIDWIDVPFDWAEWR